MEQLEALTREAAALGANSPVAGLSSGPASGFSLLSGSEAEVARVMQICNACRYCEGYCAVFPAMTHRLEFGKSDVHFLANLCHNCGACLHACQYAPPHEFAVNVPQAMAAVRVHTYSDYAWPKALGALYKRNGLTLALASACGLALFLVLTMLAVGTLSFGANVGTNSGNFYAIFPHRMLVLMFGITFAYALVALGIGVRRFWRDQTPGAVSGSALGEATHDALTLRYLGGGHGQGCNEADDAYTLLRRRFHHLTFYGFMLCFAATCVATLYHYAFGWHAPYDYTSLPVLLGTVGGLGLLVGPIGLLALNLKRHPLHGDANQKPMDRGFIALLLLVSASGLLLLAARDTAAMSVFLAIHLGVVMALFLTLPYGKFAHGIYRCAALLKWTVEKRNPPKLQLGNE